MRRVSIKPMVLEARSGESRVHQVMDTGERGVQVSWVVG